MYEFPVPPCSLSHFPLFIVLACETPATAASLRFPLNLDSSAPSMDDYPASDPIPNMDESYSSLMDFLRHNDALRNTARNAMAQGAWSGGGALAGGLLGGPVGGLVGGIIGSVVGFVQADEYEGALQNLNSLPQPQRQALVRSVASILTAAGGSKLLLTSTSEFQKSLVSLAEQESVRNQIWQACVDAMKE